MKKGKLIICSAPSGSGKTTLIKHLLKQNLNLHFSISATSRAPRGEEIDGKDYYFLSKEDFMKKVDNHEFVEWEEVYEGIYYGTLKAEIENLLSVGKNVIFDVDVVGGLHLKTYYGERALALFISPPSVEILALRLRLRGTDSEEVISRRLEKSEFELSFGERFDSIIVNEELEASKKEIVRQVSQFISHQ